MSINIPTHFVQQYKGNLELLLQQKGSRLREAVSVGSYSGKAASPVDQYGSIEMLPVSTRFGAMSRVDASTDRRWVYPSDFELPQLIDTFDKLKLIADPQSIYVQNAVAAAGRKFDQLILAAAIGTSKTGETGATSTVLPTAQKVVVGFGAASDVGLTVAKLREAKRLLMKANVDLDADPLYCAIGADQHDNLLAEAQVVSTDFNDKPVLVEGKLSRFLGINFIHTELSNATAQLLSGDALIPMWAKSGLHLGIWNDIEVSVEKRTDLSSIPYQVYCKVSAGATRIEEAKVVQIACNI